MAESALQSVSGVPPFELWPLSFVSGGLEEFTDFLQQPLMSSSDIQGFKTELQKEYFNARWYKDASDDAHSLALMIRAYAALQNPGCGSFLELLQRNLSANQVSRVELLLQDVFTARSGGAPAGVHECTKFFAAKVRLTPLAEVGGFLDFAKQCTTPLLSHPVSSRLAHRLFAPTDTHESDTPAANESLLSALQHYMQNDPAPCCGDLIGLVETIRGVELRRFELYLRSGVIMPHAVPCLQATPTSGDTLDLDNAEEVGAAALKHQKMYSNLSFKSQLLHLPDPGSLEFLERPLISRIACRHLAEEFQRSTPSASTAVEFDLESEALLADVFDRFVHMGEEGLTIGDFIDFISSTVRLDGVLESLFIVYLWDTVSVFSQANDVMQEIFNISHDRHCLLRILRQRPLADITDLAQLADNLTSAILDEDAAKRCFLILDDGSSAFAKVKTPFSWAMECYMRKKQDPTCGDIMRLMKNIPGVDRRRLEIVLRLIAAAEQTEDSTPVEPEAAHTDRPSDVITCEDGGLVSHGHARLDIPKEAVAMDVEIGIIEHFSGEHHVADDDGKHVQTVYSVVSCTPSGLVLDEPARLRVNISGFNQLHDEYDLRIIHVPGLFEQTEVTSEDITRDCDLKIDGDIATFSVNHFSDYNVMAVDMTQLDQAVLHSSTSDFISAKSANTVMIKLFFQWLHRKKGELSIVFGPNNDHFSDYDSRQEKLSMMPFKLEEGEKICVHPDILGRQWEIPRDQLEDCLNHRYDLSTKAIVLDVVPRADDGSAQVFSSPTISARFYSSVEPADFEKEQEGAFEMIPVASARRSTITVKATELAPEPTPDAGPWGDPRFVSGGFRDWIESLDEETLRTEALEACLIDDRQQRKLRSCKDVVEHTEEFMAYMMRGGVEAFNKFVGIVGSLYPHKRKAFERLAEPRESTSGPDFEEGEKESQRNPWIDKRFYLHRSWVRTIPADDLRRKATASGLLLNNTWLATLQKLERQGPVAHCDRFLRYVMPGEYVTFDRFLAVAKNINEKRWSALDKLRYPPPEPSETEEQEMAGKAKTIVKEVPPNVYAAPKVPCPPPKKKEQPTANNPTRDDAAPNTPPVDEDASDSPYLDEDLSDTPCLDENASDTPYLGEGDPNTPPADDASNTPPADEAAPNTPSVDEGAPNTPPPDEDAPNTPPPDEDAPNTPPPDEDAPNTPSVDEDAPNTPPPDEAAPNTPSVDEAATNTPPPDEDAPNTPPPDEAASIIPPADQDALNTPSASTKRRMEKSPSEGRCAWWLVLSMITMALAVAYQVSKYM